MYKFILKLFAILSISIYAFIEVVASMEHSSLFYFSKYVLSLPIHVVLTALLLYFSYTSLLSFLISVIKG
jgi:multisubunit Na+/H+ antiporter MnhC subunit